MDRGADGMSLRFAHAMIQVRDLEACIAFYAQALGLRVAERHDYDGASLAYLRDEGGRCEIELLCEQPWRFHDRPEKGRTHIAFTVSNVDAENARLRALGVPCGDVMPYVANGKLQTRFFYLYDPEGNEIEILEDTGRYSA
jgi:lactoylglutathione lyase